MTVTRREFIPGILGVMVGLASAGKIRLGKPDWSPSDWRDFLHLVLESVKDDPRFPTSAPIEMQVFLDPPPARDQITVYLDRPVTKEQWVANTALFTAAELAATRNVQECYELVAKRVISAAEAIA